MTTVEMNAAWQSTDRAADWLAGLRALQQRYGSAAALELWNSAAEKFPNTAAIQIGHAICYERLDRVAEAQELFEQIVARWPDNPAGYAGYLRTLCRCRGDAAALDEWRLAASQFPRTLQIQMGYASCCERLGRDDEAIEAFTRISTEWPNHSRGLLGQIRCVQRRDGPMVADKLWCLAAQQFPEELVIRLGFAANLEQLERWQEASEAYSWIAGTWPRDQRAHRGCLRCSPHIDSPEEVLAKYRHWTVEFPDDLAPILALARCQEQQGLIDVAQASYWRCLEISPDAVQARCGLARICELREGPEALVAERLAIAADFPGSVQAVTECLQLLIRSRRLHELRPMVETVLTGFADQPSVQLIAVDALMALGQRDRAEAICDALWDNGHRTRACLTRMVALLRGSGRREEARSLCTLWFSLSPHPMDTNPLQEILQKPSTASGSGLSPDKRAWLAWRSIKGSQYNWHEWYEEAVQNARRNEILRRCVECNSERLWELDAITIPPDMRDLKIALAREKGCILAGSHQGAIAAAIRFFDTGDRPFYTFAQAGVPDRVGTSRLNTIASDRGVFGALRQILHVLNEGAIVAIAADGKQIHETVGLRFLNGWLRISALIPRLALRTGVPSFYSGANWIDGKVVMTLKSLPDPEPGEKSDAYVLRWCEAYGDELQVQVRTYPDLLHSNVVFGQAEGLPWITLKPKARKSSPAKISDAQATRRVSRIQRLRH